MEMNSEYNFRLTICCNIDLNGGRLQFYLLIYAYKRTNHITTQFTLSLDSNAIGPKPAANDLGNANEMRVLKAEHWIFHIAITKMKAI